MKIKNLLDPRMFLKITFIFFVCKSVSVFWPYGLHSYLCNLQRGKVLFTPLALAMPAHRPKTSENLFIYSEHAKTHRLINMRMKVLHTFDKVFTAEIFPVGIIVCFVSLPLPEIGSF